MLKINLGCGTNKLDGWSNHDMDVDIEQRLPWRSDSADVIFAEHVVEHVTYNAAVAFFMECHRVLRPGGVLRIAVPSIERVWREATPSYCSFTERWVTVDKNADGNTRLRGAMTNILHRHGHKAPWTQGLLMASMFYAGFDEVTACRPGSSHHEELLGLEGHGRVIGDDFNEIETVVAEATK